MPFVNARITPKEYEQYRLGEIDKNYAPMSNVSSQWTLDRDRNIHMRVVSRTVPPDMGGHDPFQLFWWKTGYVIFGCKYLQHATKDNDWQSHQKLTRLEIPASLLRHRDEIIEDVRHALTAYGTGGVYCLAEGYKLKFELSSELSLLWPR